MAIRRIAVVGGGIMGNGIAHLCAQGGRDVSLIDVSTDVLNAAVETIGKNLVQAMTYLRSHGELDRDHVEHLAGVLNRLDSSEDQHAVLANARTFYWLYASVFSAIDASMPAPGERKRA
jgi:3-hydroxybutyryl-CoA dehydrogenase